MGMWGLAVLGCVYSLVCVLGAGTGTAAAVTEFGEEGVHAGQLKNPQGVAVNQQTGDLYVADMDNFRIDRLDASGNWLMAWGWGVNEESPAEELQTCTSFCEAGELGTGAGAYKISGPVGVAVDNNKPSSSNSRGDVYVADFENYRVQKFGPQGEFILMFGGGVITGGAAGTGDITAGSATVTSVTTISKAFLEGQTVTGAGIPPGTRIKRVGSLGLNDVGTLTLSRPATGSGTGVALTVAEGVGNVPTNERQTVTISGTPTGGTFTLTFTAPNPTPNQETTAAITYPAPSGEGTHAAGSVEAALEELPNIGHGNVEVTGSDGGPYTVEFKGRYADTNVAKMTRESSLEGGEVEEFIATPVEGHSAPEVCATASICQAGAPGAADGQFNWAGEGTYIAVGPKGELYVGDQARVQVFEQSGAWKENISLAGLSSETPVTALAVDATGDVFVKDREVSGVHEFAPNGAEMLTVFDEGSGSIQALALDATGNLYVDEQEQEGELHVVKYDPAGNELARFGSKAVASSAGMAFGNTSGKLYVTGSKESSQGSKVPISRGFVLTPPPPGPLVEPGSESATRALHGEATLEAMVNPEGHETTYHFEYLTEEQFKADGETFAAGTVATAESAPITGEPIELFEDHLARAELSEATLLPGVSYRWRVVASNECEAGKTCTATGAGASFAETPSALIDGPWAEAMTSTTVTLAAQIDPQGMSTSYRVEYGTSTAYGHTLTGNVGEGTEYEVIGYHVQALLPATTYHYRVVTSNQCEVGKTCTEQSTDHTFTTLPAATTSSALPDGRAWELVTPANTGGALLDLSSAPSPVAAASDGSAITYVGKGTVLGEEPVSDNSLFPAQVFSRRGPHDWESQDINSPIGPTPEGEDFFKKVLSHGFYSVFSTDLASAVLSTQPRHGVLTADALKGTQYLRNDLTCRSEPATCYTALLTPANTPPGTELEVLEFPKKELISLVTVSAATPDLSHILLSSPLRLTGDAVEYVPRPVPSKGYQTVGIGGNIYEWSGGRLQLVNVLPDGKTDESQMANLGGDTNGSGETQRAVSGDGRVVAWTVGTPYVANQSVSNFRALYVRDMFEERTAHVGGLHARYQTMSNDGSRVFYLEKGDLYEYHVAPGTPYDAGTTTDLTENHGPGEASAGVQESVSDVSEDGSSVYFVANGVLGDGAEHGARPGDCESVPLTEGTCNLYLVRNNGGAGWEEPKFIATLSSKDEKSWYSTSIGGEPILANVSSRISPDGRYLAFMSQRSLTGYDNVDANPAAYEMHEVQEKLAPVLDTEGRPVRARDEEVFLYDSSTGRLACVSCDPSGARPHGVLDGGSRPLFVDPRVWGEVGDPHWLAGNLPGWENTGGFGEKVYQPRYLSNDGRLFFDSPEALVAQDTNGLEDVYQYEPAGVGSCAVAGGCVSLMSSGHSGSESAFMDASENGDDVFFLSSDHLTTADTDTGYDVWDAHVCSASSPCLAPPVSPPPCSSGDTCKPAPAPQPELFGPAPSATFSGAGNVTPAPPLTHKAKPLTRLQKLSKALASCRKRYKHSKKRRGACERTARKHHGYVPKRARKAKAIKRGGK
jgi:hypothetical protein